MSQHYFSNSHYDVLVGWDRPLQGFFLVIDEEHSDGNMPLTVYTNLCEKVPHPKTFDHFESVLKRFGVELPNALMEELLVDQKIQAGNKMVFWDQDGSRTEPHVY